MYVILNTGLTCTIGRGVVVNGLGFFLRLFLEDLEFNGTENISEIYGADAKILYKESRRF